MARRRCVAVATGHTESVGAAALSVKAHRYAQKGADAGAFVVSASKDRTLKKWVLGNRSFNSLSATTTTTEEPLPLAASRSVVAHDKDVNVVAVSPNDALVATGSQDRTVKLWNAVDLSLRVALVGHKRGVWDCRFSPVDRAVATASADQTIKLWSTQDGDCARTFQVHAGSVLRVRFLRDGAQLASSGGDGLVKVWTVRTKACETTMDGQVDRAKHLRRVEHGPALELDRHQLTLSVLKAIVEDARESSGATPVEALRRRVATWDADRVARVLRYCRDWNTRARNSYVANLVVRVVTARFR